MKITKSAHARRVVSSSLVVVSLSFLAVSSIITLSAIHSRFDGFIELKLGRDGVQVVIDGRTSHQRVE